MSNKIIAYALFPWQNDINMEFYVITVYCIGNVLSMMSSLKSHCVFGYKERNPINPKLHTLSCRTTCIILHCCSAFLVIVDADARFHSREYFNTGCM